MKNTNTYPPVLNDKLIAYLRRIDEYASMHSTSDVCMRIMRTLTRDIVGHTFCINTYLGPGMNMNIQLVPYCCKAPLIQIYMGTDYIVVSVSKKSHKFKNLQGFKDLPDMEEIDLYSNK